MSLTTKGHDYDHEEMIVENGSEEVGQETEEIANYFDETQNIENATSDTLTSQVDGFNNGEPEWQEEIEEAYCLQKDDKSIYDNNEYADDSSGKPCFDFECVEDDDSSSCIGAECEPVAEEGSLSSENLFDPCDDAPPPPDDSMVPPECYKSSSSNKSTNASDEDEEEDSFPKMFSTNVGIENGYYGTYYKSKEDEEYKFTPLGKAIYLRKAIKNIANDSIKYELEFEAINGMVKKIIPREYVFNPRTIQDLSRYGADVPPKHVNTVIDSIRTQEELDFTKAGKISLVHDDLGWQKFYNSKKCKVDFFFKASSSIGEPFSQKSKYTGDMAVSCNGNTFAWKKMVETHVLGRPALETILIASLSSVVVGLIAEVTTGECPILHFADSSSSGKTTAAMLAASVAGKPFNGGYYNARTGKIQNSLLQSWGGTTNAILGMQKGNMGFPIILDELSKIDSKIDLTQLVYNFSEGTDKARMTQNLDVSRSAPFRTSIISVGEVSLLDKCKAKNDGLRMRVFEISGKLTDDAQHSREIKRLCRENYGYAINNLSKYIIDHGGREFVLNTYKEIILQISAKVPDCQNKERFVEKFYAVYLTTAYIARKALRIDFSLKRILNFLNENLCRRIESGDNAEGAYQKLIEHFNANAGHIYQKGVDSDKRLECWGAYNVKKYATDNGQEVIGEYSIRKNLFEKFLRQMGYENIQTVLKGFKELGCLNYEGGRNTRRRCVGTETSELCYVLRVFKVDVSEDDLHEENKPGVPIKTFYHGQTRITEAVSTRKAPVNNGSKSLLA